MCFFIPHPSAFILSVLVRAAGIEPAATSFQVRYAPVTLRPDFQVLVGRKGFEPLTGRLKVCCVTTTPATRFLTPHFCTSMGRLRFERSSSGLHSGRPLGRMLTTITTGPMHCMTKILLHFCNQRRVKESNLRLEFEGVTLAGCPLTTRATLQSLLDFSKSLWRRAQELNPQAFTRHVSFQD